MHGGGAAAQINTRGLLSLLQSIDYGMLYAVMKIHSLFVFLQQLHVGSVK